MPRRRLLLGASTMLITPIAFAHHAAPAFFHVQEIISVEGTITGHKLANPHSYYRVTTDDGVDWAFESGPSWTSLVKLGWTAETIPNGTRVRMTGNPARNGRPIARYQTILVLDADGTEGLFRLYGDGRAEGWVSRARSLGRDCPRVEACVELDSAALETLQAEFGDIGVWSELREE